MSAVTTVQSFVSEVITNELGKRSIFLPTETKTTSTLMRRLAKTGMLFQSHSTPLKGVAGPSSLSTSKVLPYGEVSKFHKFFAGFCVENGFANMLLEYLDHYGLGMNHQQVRDAI